MSSNNKVIPQENESPSTRLSSLAFTQFMEKIDLSFGGLSRDSFAVFVCDGESFIESNNSPLLDNLHFPLEGSIMPKIETSSAKLNKVYATNIDGFIKDLDTIGIPRNDSSIVVLGVNDIEQSMIRKTEAVISKPLRLK